MKADDLNIGDWVAMTWSRMGERFIEVNPDSELGYTGDPLEIQAISLPFICVRNVSGDVAAMDTRDHRFTRVNRNYVDAMSLAGRQQRIEMEVEPDAPFCPNCTADLKAKMGTAGNKTWRCVRCAFMGVVVE